MPGDTSATMWTDYLSFDELPKSIDPGTHDLYLLFRGDPTGQLFNFDYWKFNKKGAKPPKS